MLKAGTFDNYAAEMDKAISEGKVRLLTEEEMSVWHEEVHYISTFAVVKPDSLSHCVNSVMKNTKTKVSLNNCMWGRPNTLADLLMYLFFWRGSQLQ